MFKISLAKQNTLGVNHFRGIVQLTALYKLSNFLTNLHAMPVTRNANDVHLKAYSALGRHEIKCILIVPILRLFDF